MNDMISSDNHFVSNDVQRLIRSYRSCPSITNNGTECRSSLTTNKFVDPTNIPKTKTSRKTKSRSASREQLQLRPIERSRRSEPLVYHGIAHPDIHRISRKNRPESHYRPRHFHSPRRQTSIGKQPRK